MKKSLFAIFAAALSFAALAVEPVPMVDVKVQPEGMELQTRTAVSRDTETAIIKAYSKALNDAVQERGKLDILAVGKRATVVITEYYDPKEFQTAARNDMEDRMAFGAGGGMVNPSAPGFQRAYDRRYNNGRPEQAKIAGYIEFDGKRMPFEESANAGTPMEWIAADVGRDAFRRILAL